MKSILLRDHYRDISGWGRSKRMHIRHLEDGVSARLCRMGPSFPVSGSMAGVTRAIIVRGLRDHRVVPVCPICEEKFMKTLEESNG